MTVGTKGRGFGWLIFVVLAVAAYGNYYVYDSIGPVADLLQRERGFSNTQIGMLNAIYSLPNVILVLLGGVLVDRFGAARMMVWTTAVCLAGATLTALSPSFEGMAGGRFLFGMGAKTFNIATLAALARHFTGKNLALSMGLNLSIGRAGSYSADMSPTWFPRAYIQGWQPPLVIAIWMAAISFAAAVAYWWMDRRASDNATAAAAPNAKRFILRDLLRLGAAYWYLLILGVFWYAVILAFRSTFSIKYFEHTHGLDLATAGAMNSYVFLAAIFATPAFGWLCDRIGRYAPMLAFGASLLPISIILMAATDVSLWVATAIIGVSYSLVPAVMWPLISKLVSPARFGTALGLILVGQNVGVAGANLIAGWLNDLSGASAINPAGYQPMMIFFGVESALGFGFSLLLWLTAGRRQHEEFAPVAAAVE